MRRMAVPVTTRLLAREDFDKIVEQLHQIGAQYVFIGKGSVIVDPVKRQEELELLKKSCSYLSKEGFKVGIWLWSFLIPGEVPYQRMIGLNGITSKGEVCPLDEDFVEFYSGCIKEIVQYAKPDMIMFDDDFGFGHEDNNAQIECACPLHLKKMSEIAGEEITIEGIEEKMFTGKPNKYRDAYIQAMRETLIGFADKMRQTVDEVDPSMRLGICALMSAWNTDGVDSYEIAKHLAGNQKPLVRLIGAPYWGVDRLFGNNRLQDVINLQRMEASWRYGDVEVLYEGDPYPRPRFATPANYLEAYDMALLADGTADGIIKYIIDFTASTKYEQGYIERHLRNAPNYDWIMKNMKDKQAAGIRIYEFLHTVKTANLPDEYLGHDYLRNRFMSPASRMMTACSIPITYSGKGCCGAAFGENIRYLSEEQLKGGIITDIEGAKVLGEFGIDTGIEKWGDFFKPSSEYYHTEDEYVAIRNEDSCVAVPNAPVQEVELNEKASVQSSFICDDKRIPASFIYENDKGYKFLIFTFDAYRSNESVYRSYTRSRQLMNAVTILSGNKLPAMISGNPDLYVLTKQDEKTLSVGLWNLFPDGIYSPKIKLDKVYKSIECCSCTAKLNGDEVELSDIAPYGFAAFTVSK